MEENIVDPKQEVIRLKKQVSVLETELSQYQSSGAVAFYYELNRWVNETNDYMKLQKISSLIGAEDKDKKFDRVMKLIESAKENVTKLEELRAMLKITGDKVRDMNDNEIAGKDFVSNIATKRI